MKKIPVEYRLMSLEFRNGRAENERRLGFRAAFLFHDDRQRAVVIEGVRNPEPGVFEELSPFEISAIRYEIRAEGFAPVPYCHPFPSGTGVFLQAIAGDADNLFLARRNQLPFFSDDFTLRDVSNGRIQSNQAAYQFHE